MKIVYCSADCTHERCWLCGLKHDCAFRGERLAWHMTSEENWERIRSSGGLDLYKTHPDVSADNGPTLGIYTWFHRQTGRALAGSVIFHLANKPTVRVVRLAVRYRYLHTIHPDGRRYHVMHHQVPPTNFWHVQEPGLLLAKRVPLDRITFERLWDFEELVK
jgi:hypothetical protein